MRLTAFTTVALLLAMPQLSACAAQQGANAMSPDTTASVPAAGQSRFIVKFREGSAPLQDTRAVQSKLASVAPAGVQLEWQRRLGVQADLFFTSRPLDAAEAEALMQRFRDDPDVEYIEPDGRMGIDPIRGPELRSDS